MKLQHLLLGAAVLGLASCSHDEITKEAPAVDGNVRLTVNLPGNYGTRAGINQGLTAVNLDVLVYDADNNNALVFQTSGEKFSSTSLSTEVGLNLATGKSYLVALFASAPENNVYSLDAENGTLSVNYSLMNDAGMEGDLYDCFYNYLEFTVAKGGNQLEAILYRPIAQINWGTNDLQDDENGNSAINDANAFGTDGEYVVSTLVTDAYTMLNLYDGDVIVGSSQTITIANLQNPANYGMTYPKALADEGYQYVAMQYVLAPKDNSANYDLKLTINNADNPGIANFQNDIVVANAPVQANYQTNIYGSLLSDNVDIKVTKEKDWNINTDGTQGEAYDRALTWDGTTATYPDITKGPGTPVNIDQPSDLAGLADMVNGYIDSEGNTVAPNPLEGYTFVLTGDMDMGGNDFPGIGSATRDGQTPGDDSNAFRGTFDGNGKTISNLNISYTDGEADTAVGFIPNLDGSNSIVKDVYFENLTIDGGAAEQVAVVGLVSNGATVSGVTVNSGTISAAEGAAGIVGRVLGAGTISSCTNKAAINTTTKSSGGICGAAYYTSSENSVVISNCVNEGNITGSATAGSIGGIVGVSGATISGCTNKGNVTGNSTLGGIVGYQNSTGGITYCYNYGNVTGSGNYVAGIVGWEGGVGYDFKSVIEINNNTNYGDITANGGQAAGIMTINRGTCNLDNNTNNGSVTASGTAAGILSGGFYAETPYNGGNGYVNYGTNTNNSTEITGNKVYMTYGGVVWLTATDEASTGTPEN